MFDGELPRDVDLAMTGFEEHSDWIIIKTEYTKKRDVSFCQHFHEDRVLLTRYGKKKELTYH